MKSNFELLKKIKGRSAKVCVIGMGYVGYPLYEVIKKNKFSVYGLEIDKNKIRQLKKKNKINVSSNYKLINQSDIIIFALPTPLNQKKNPDLSILKNSIRKSFKFFKKGQLVIVESTSYPGTTKECLKQVIKKFDIGKNFFISYSPERIDPGNKNFDVKNITKIISGYTDTCLNLSNNFYKIICNLTVKASNIETAEFTKIYENIFRYVNIGLANEKKRISKKLNLDFNEIQKLASSKPFGYMNFYPGIGVGGHCIPVDPYYLVWLANKKKIKTEYVKLSGKINRSTPRIVCKEIDKVIGLRKFKKIFILGLSYKKNISDIRNSPNLEIFNYFFKKKYKINYNDDNLKNIKIGKKNFRSLKINSHNLRKQDAIIFLNNHNYYNKRNIVKNSRCIFDCTYSFPKSNKVIFI